MSEPKYPGVFVGLSGEDGNIGSIMSRVNRALRSADAPVAEQNLFRSQIFDCGSYDEALRVVMQWVEVA